MSGRRARPLVVGIGASAGGLEALSHLVGGLVPGLECLYVVAQHISPTHRSMMADILGRETALPVKELEDGQAPAPDVVYIIPPGANAVLRNGVFRLTTAPPEVAPKPSVNLLFQSLADEYDERAVGVVLSGTGSDGTRGLRAIKSVGGLTFVQNPDTAKYDGMPRSAIDAGLADRILNPEQIGRELERLIRFPGPLSDFESREQRPAELETLFARVRESTKIDFSSYKFSTVQRRLQRRMVATNSTSLASYLAYIDANPGELDALAKETLISVTEFFRDRDAFRSLERCARDLVERKQPGEDIRVWVVGCATGEEAYSLGIMFLELMGGPGEGKPRLQIFATDIDNEALAAARRGLYNQAAMAEMPADYAARYFVANGSDFEPIKALRDCVTFARQDIAADPPFLRLDLITCRNVLIYFNADLQARVLMVLRYALADEGLLFLGRSESVNQQENLFAPTDRRARIFRPRGNTRPARIGKLMRGQLTPVTMPPRPPRDKTHERLFFGAVADRYGPAMLVDGGLRILHSHGDVASYIQFPAGAPEMNLAQLIVPELSRDLLTALHCARRDQGPAHSRERYIGARQNRPCRLGVHPLGEHGDNDLYLVVFESPPPRLAAVEGRGEGPAESADDLASTREQLQALTEEMAASNEEMQALNEEIQAANEELQATNEELEASNEELQATNEELISVNEESLAKSAELATVNADFESVYNTLDFPVLVFDTDLFLKRANGAAMRAYDLPASCNGQHIGRLGLPGHLAQVDRALATSIAEQRKQSFALVAEARTYKLFVTPVVGVTGIIQGIVLAVVDNTDLVVAQERVMESQERLLSIMNHSVSVIALKDAAGRYEFVNQRFEEAFGVKAEEVLGKTDHQLFPPEMAKLLRGRDLKAMEDLDAVESMDEMELNASRFWLDAVRFPIFDAGGTLRAVCTQAVDVTRKRHAEEQLRLATKLFDRSGEAIVIADASGAIITVNDAFTAITGYKFSEVVGKNPRLLQSGRHSPEFYEDLWRALQTSGSWQGEIYNRRKSGEVYPEWLTINAVRTDDGTLVNYVAIFSDITAIKTSQRRIEFLATHDGLTGLPNRSLLIDRLKHGMLQAKRRGQKVAVLFVDLDNFKTVNDSLGHDIGDELLRQAAERLQRCIRDADTLARLGGDEFVALLVDVDLAELNSVAARIVEFLGASFPIREQELFVSASIGIAMFPDDGEDAMVLLKNADAAMYRAKERGRNQYQFFSEDMKVLALRRLTLETALRQALDAGYLRMVYQPQVDLRGGGIVGAEALVRWTDPNLGVVSPEQFIPVAESAGLIGRVGEIVFEQVLKQVAQWQAAGLDLPPISINTSVHQLQEAGFAERVAAWADRHGVALSRLVLEITESALANRIDVVGSVLEQLERLGATLSIDDFGTGYSSLYYLKRLPIHELKVDRRFVDGIAEDAEDRAISTAIIDMAHALGMTVVAEGVETQAQRDTLSRLGCDSVQGYFYHRPLAPDAFAALIAAAVSKTTHEQPEPSLS